MADFKTSIIPDHVFRRGEEGFLPSDCQKTRSAASQGRMEREILKTPPDSRGTKREAGSKRRSQAEL